MRRKRIAVVGGTGSARWSTQRCRGRMRWRRRQSSASTEIEGLGSTLEEIQANAKNEGEVNLVIWAGYADKSWADQFTQETGCKVNTKDGASSDDMVDLMSTGAYDGVSASGDATLRLIAKGDVAPVNFDLIPNYADVYEGLKDQSYNTVDGVGYGVPHGRGANLHGVEQRRFCRRTTTAGRRSGPAPTTRASCRSTTTRSSSPMPPST